MDPGYDVLEFLIKEAHNCEIEFHAWMNPYRIATRADAGTSYPALHPSIEPEWVVSHEKIQIYNPAIPEVRQRLTDIVKDLITKYDVDGVHFDDYFYPAPSAAGQMVPDESDYEKYGENYASIEEFRRANVDKAVVLTITDQNEINIDLSGYYSVSTINAENKEGKPSEVVKKD